MDLYLAAVSVTPNVGDGPGGDALQKIVNWIAGVSILGCLVALIVAGATWGFAHRQGLTGQETAAKKAAGWALAGALVIGASAGLINFFVSAGGTVSGPPPSPSSTATPGAKPADVTIR
jgi:hypothetical protein